MAWGQPSRERRVLKAGHSSIAVTLPKPWAEAMNLRPGDLIVFDQNDDGTLFLKPAPLPGAATVGAPYLVQAYSFDAPGVLARLVVGAYRVGHDSIEIRTEQPLGADRVEELQQAARGLLGVSVVAHEPSRVVLQTFIDPSKYGLPQLVQRMKMILVAFLEESEELLARPRRKHRVTGLTEEANKVLALLVRQLFLASRDWSLARRIGSPDPRQLLEWRVVVHALEELAQILGDVARELRGAPPARGVDPGLEPMLGEFKTELKSIVEALVRPSLSQACESYAEATRLAESARAAQGRVRGPARRSGLLPALVSMQRGASSLAILAQIALDRAVANGSETILVQAP